MAFCKFLQPVLECLVSGSGVVATSQERVADFDRGVYTVVGEIESKRTGRMYQNFEQLVGWLQKDQNLMLGLVVNPTKISQQILVVITYFAHIQLCYTYLMYYWVCTIEDFEIGTHM